MTPEEEKATADKAAADAKAKAEAEAGTPAALKARAEAAEKARDEYKADMLKYKQAAQQTAEEKEKAKAEAAKAEEERLKNGNQFKELYEKSQIEMKELSEKGKRQAAAFVQTLKVSAVQQAAQLAGLLPAAIADLNAVDLSTVEAVQSESGLISIQNVDPFISKLKTDRPHWFGTGTPPKITMPGSGAAGAASGNKPTAEEMLKLQASDPDAYQKAMKTHFMA